MRISSLIPKNHCQKMEKKMPAILTALQRKKYAKKVTNTIDHIEMIKPFF